MVVPAWPFVRKEPRFLMTTFPYLPDAIILFLSPPAFAMDIGLDVYFLFTSYPPCQVEVTILFLTPPTHRIYHTEGWRRL